MIVGTNISRALNRASVCVLHTVYLESSTGERDRVLGTIIHVKEGRRTLEAVPDCTKEGRGDAIYNLEILRRMEGERCPPTRRSQENAHLSLCLLGSPVIS